jgi:endonuclease/exonuclease/phosphatase family metal-dependent hydrolase
VGLRLAALAALVLVLPAGVQAKDAPTGRITVMTRNLYLGADLTPLFQPQPVTDLLTNTGKLWAAVQANDFAARAQAVAKEIAAARPDVVGLQEAPLYRSDEPWDGPFTPAEKVELDYLQVLLAATKQAGVEYRVAGSFEGTDAELPLGLPPVKDIRFTDRIAVLVRKDSQVKVRDVVAGAYGASVAVSVAGSSLPVRRGFVSIGMRLGKTKFRLVDTHLEAFDPRVLQGQQLLAGTKDTQVPMILLGDFNSGPGGDRTVYDAFTGAGFQDAWLEAHPGDATSVTCCHADDLRDPSPALRSRIDLVVLKGDVRAVSASIVGAAPSTRVNGLWPSDHAGTVATLQLG